MEKAFNQVAEAVAHAAGKPWAFAFALCLASVLVWGGTGPVFDYSETWQLIINTGTTIITFLMAFLIKNTQNRDGAAIPYPSRLSSREFRTAALLSDMGSEALAPATSKARVSMFSSSSFMSSGASCSRPTTSLRAASAQQ
ncbi:low affinity iron permease family protein [Mesorhizobium captivum]|uniref:low affinity iron permease family protein n=1 Tax=Mesorhizobium captivum TaxID=3072319 RepID=UPI002A23B6CB|nr:low affinity iron permease family protein [Mesorhizobium sp. VK3C]MDX8449137.1 low affinity iron permease family protein [Mesorhizobium sp. VK3C]